MDNLTHSLIGAVLGQAGLKRKTGLAMPTLIIAANLPDIDATCTVLGMVSLAMRRGITHGPIALLVLPLLLTGAMVWFDRWQARRGTRPEDRLPVRPGWLLASAFIGCLSHPLFDWMNSYGIRLLEPFSHRWFYGDALFIVDPWLLAILGAGIWFSRRREKAGTAFWNTPSQIAVACAALYIITNIAISNSAVNGVKNYEGNPPIAVANPVPLAFWRRHVLVRNTQEYGAVDTWGDVNVSLPFGRIGLDDPRIALRVAQNPEAQAFLFWSRMPIAEKSGDAIILRDQRFMDSMTSSRFQVRLEP